jgi:type I restriction enzyme S subunit
MGLLSNLELPLPDLTTQRKIAGILSAYDDLIENNLRRIKILEEMAQSLYREWFVHFRFPGHESAKFVDCGPGRIPEGWKPASLGSLCKTIREKFDETRDSELPLLDLSRMPSKTLAPSEFGASGDLGTSRILFKAGDTLFGSIRPYLHKVCRAPVSGITNVSVLVLRPLNNRYSALVSAICSTSDAIQWAEQHSTGLKMPVIKWDQLAKFPISLPSESILNRFDSFVSPAMAEIGSLSQRNLVLRATRDLLLPKLLSAQFISELLPPTKSS